MKKIIKSKNKYGMIVCVLFCVIYFCLGCGQVCLLSLQLRPDLGRDVLHVQKPDLYQGLGLFSALRS